MLCQCVHEVKLGLMKLFMFEIAFNRTVPLLMHKPSAQKTMFHST